MTDEQYKAFKTALQLEEQSEDEFLTTWLNNEVEGSLDRHPKRREALLRVWGNGLSERKDRSGLTNQPIIITGTPAKQIYEQILKMDKGMQLNNVGTEENPILRVEEW